MVQVELFAPRRGGKRPGAGRPARGPRPSERHKTRERLTRHTPVHVTIRVVPLPSSLRTPDLYHAIRAATITAGHTEAMHVVHLSIQSNHVHLLVEAPDQYSLSRGMQGFQISAAKHINRALGRKGRVFQDRYHAHVLRTPREARNAVRYVLNNWRKHGAQSPIAFDAYSTACWFPSWCDAAWEPERFDDPAVKWALWIWRPTSWLLRKVEGISAFDVPGA